MSALSTTYNGIRYFVYKSLEITHGCCKENLTQDIYSYETTHNKGICEFAHLTS